MKRQYLILLLLVFITSCDPWHIAIIENNTNSEAYFYYKCDTSELKHYNSKVEMLTKIFSSPYYKAILIDSNNLTAFYKIKPKDVMWVGQCMGKHPFLPISECMIKTKNHTKTYMTRKDFNDAFNYDKKDTYILKIE